MKNPGVHSYLLLFSYENYFYLQDDTQLFKQLWTRGVPALDEGCLG